MSKKMTQTTNTTTTTDHISNPLQALIMEKSFIVTVLVSKTYLFKRKKFYKKKKNQQQQL